MQRRYDGTQPAAEGLAANRKGAYQSYAELGHGRHSQQRP